VPSPGRDGARQGATRVPVSVVPPARVRGPTRPCSWSHPPVFVVPAWSLAAPSRGTIRGARTNPVVPAWSLVSHGKSAPWSHRGPCPLSWGGDHPWSQHHADGGPPLVPALAPRRARTAPRVATGRGVGAVSALRGDGDEAAPRRPARRVLIRDRRRALAGGPPRRPQHERPGKGQHQPRLPGPIGRLQRQQRQPLARPRPHERRPVREGVAALDPRVEGSAVYATSATTKRLQAATRATPPATTP